MKLYSQHGFAQGEKTIQGIMRGYIDGVIYSPRDISVELLRKHISEVTDKNPKADQLFDPQYYAAYNITHPESRLGRLVSCEEYGSYFRQRRRRELERDTAILTSDIEDCLAFQNSLNVTKLISPNILISRSFDSIESVIAKNFIRLSGQKASELGYTKPLYATLAISREALMNREELFSFLEDITILDDPPTGFYVLIAASNEDARAEIFHADVIAGWLLVNHSLSINGFDVINGYSDLLTPFLRIAGATAGATGWWSNLRTFSLDRFLPAGEGRLPIPRYLSKLLLNRINHIELAQIVDLRSRITTLPNVLNGLVTDTFYPENEGFAPARSDEVLQSWQALKDLCKDLCRDKCTETLELCRKAIKSAINAYDLIQPRIRLDQRSNGEHLAALEEGLRLFLQHAEIADSGAELG